MASPATPSSRRRSLERLRVRGLTIAQVRRALRNAYTRGPKAVLQPGRDHIHVSLQRPRTVRVIVIREEAGNVQGNRGPAGTVNFEIDKRGTGRVVELPAHRNDVLNALAETGGLPGLDAENVIYVIRGQRPHAAPMPPQQPAPAENDEGTYRQLPRYPSTDDPQIAVVGPYYPEAQTHRLPQYPTIIAPQPAVADHDYPKTPSEAWCAVPYVPQGPTSASHIIRIPLKAIPGEPLPFGPQDVILHDGDIVLVENRVTEFFYTAGLLGGGQITLPRDYDLGVMDAIALAEAENFRLRPTVALGGVSVWNQDVTVGASRVIIQRKLPGGGWLPIEVNLYDVMKHPEEQIIIQPEDRIILRYTRTESILAYIERHLLVPAAFGAANRLNDN